MPESSPRVIVELTYDMSKMIGENRVEVAAATVADAVTTIRERFESDPEAFDRLTSRTAIAVNGVLVRYRNRLGTPLAEGDTLSFVKAAAGG